MGLFSRKPSEPQPRTPPPYEQAPPEGYRWALLADQMLPLVCQECGASVAWESGVDIHLAWHESQASS